LAQCRPILSAFQVAAKKYPSPLDFAIFAYVRTDDQLDARMFAPLDNIFEDPATGSACATITALLSQIAETPLAFVISQGEDMGRPSTIHAAALGGDPMPIRVSGQAVCTMIGQLTI
jgi:trans-2,3-dihydro-3-hydroxyanthranilate isomerase